MVSSNDASAAKRRAKFPHPSAITRPPAAAAFPLRREDVRRIVADLLG